MCHGSNAQELKYMGIFHAQSGINHLLKKSELQKPRISALWKSGLLNYPLYK